MDNPDIFEGKLNKYIAGWNLENTGGFDQYTSFLSAFLIQAVGDADLRGVARFAGRNLLSSGSC